MFLPYLYLILSIFCMAFDSILATFYDRKAIAHKHRANFYYLVLSASVFVSWLVYYLIDFSFDIKVLPYSIAFAVSFTSCFIFQIKAIQAGPMSLTALMLQFSLIAVTLYGIIFGWQGAKFTYLVAIGLALTTISLVLCLYEKPKDGEKRKISFKWFLYAFIAFVSNAASAIIQREQQIAFDGKHGSLLMVVASFLFLVFSIFYYEMGKKDDVKLLAKHSYFPIVVGVLNFGLNLFVILLAGQTVLSSNVIYPGLMVGALTLTTLSSAFIFKEDLKWWQWVGIAVGIIAVALLNITI